MGNIKGSPVLLIAAVAMVVFLTGCEKTKHAEIMSAEQLAALEKDSGQGSVASEDTEQGRASSVGNVSGTGMGGTSSSKSAVPLISDFDPQLPPSPILQGTINAETEATGSGFTGSTADPGSSGYEDEQFARALKPLDEFNSGLREFGDDSGGSGFTDGAKDEEVVRLPDMTGAEESREPLKKGDLREGRMNGVGIE